MGLPAKLKNFNFSVDGTSYLGETTEVTQPKLA
ncbi:phage major tail tube protein, partial [Mannheimia haemolytica]|nr:phage major tail tube protein [Mannheimia haemolytica]